MRVRVLADALFVLVAVPVFASVAAAQEATTPSPSLDRNQVCVVVINIVDNDQTAIQYGVDNASPQEIAQELNVPVNVVQNCIQENGGGNNPAEPPPGEDPPVREQPPGEPPAGRDLDYEDFASQEAAQAELESGPGDPFGLDADGVACEADDEVLGDVSGSIPDTGGAPLLLGAGALAFGAALLISRVVRRTPGTTRPRRSPGR